MVWVILWVVLVLGAVLGALWLGRDLWRRGRALLAELERASEVLGRLADQAGRLADEAREAEAAARALREATLLPEPQEARARWTLLREQAAERRARRRERDRATRERWRAYSR